MSEDEKRESGGEWRRARYSAQDDLRALKSQQIPRTRRDEVASEGQMSLSEKRWLAVIAVLSLVVIAGSSFVQARVLVRAAAATEAAIERTAEEYRQMERDWRD